MNFKEDEITCVEKGIKITKSVEVYWVYGSRCKGGLVVFGSSGIRFSKLGSGGY